MSDRCLWDYPNYISSASWAVVRTNRIVLVLCGPRPFDTWRRDVYYRFRILTNLCGVKSVNSEMKRCYGTASHKPRLRSSFQAACMERAALDACHSSWWLGDTVGWFDYWVSRWSYVWIAKTTPPPSHGNHFAAVTALLINHHKLQPQLHSRVWSVFSCVLWRCPRNLVPDSPV